MIEIRNQYRNIKIKYIECRNCKKQIPRNKKNKCNKYINTIITGAQEGINNNEGEVDDQLVQEQLGESLKYYKEIN